MTDEKGDRWRTRRKQGAKADAILRKKRALSFRCSIVSDVSKDPPLMSRHQMCSLRRQLAAAGAPGGRGFTAAVLWMSAV